MVYGHPALAVPLSLGVTARATPSGRCELSGLPELTAAQRKMLDVAFDAVASATGRPPVRIAVSSTLPVSMGLGSSAALAVAVSRLLLGATGARTSPANVLALALRMEEAFHGTPSGVDHTVSAHGAPILYRRPAPGRPGRVRQVRIGVRATLVLALVGPRRGTQETVAALRRRAARWPARYGRLFKEIGRLAGGGDRGAGGRRPRGPRRRDERRPRAPRRGGSQLARAGHRGGRAPTGGGAGGEAHRRRGDGGAVVALFRRAPPAGALEREAFRVLTSGLEPTS